MRSRLLGLLCLLEQATVVLVLSRLLKRSKHCGVVRGRKAWETSGLLCHLACLSLLQFENEALVDLSLALVRRLMNVAIT